MAEGEGFEPPVPFPVQRFSRPSVSTTHTSLREGKAGCALVSLQHGSESSVRRTLITQKSERARVEFHYLGEMGEEILKAMIAGIGMVFVLHAFL